MRTTITSVDTPCSAATVNSGTRAIHGPICGISSPSATITDSSSGYGSPISSSAANVRPPTITITISFARTYSPSRRHISSSTVRVCCR
jgi:hypothetical protein